MSYKYIKDPDTGKNLTNWIRRKSDQFTIRIDDPNNEHPDYLSYKEWIAEGNTPEEAD
tara:strand:- start:620 stop:793 length:174 start_codon:yes stop_codon:yes gene_type:complete